MSLLEQVEERLKVIEGIEAELKGLFAAEGGDTSSAEEGGPGAGT